MAISWNTNWFSTWLPMASRHVQGKLMVIGSSKFSLLLVLLHLTIVHSPNFDGEPGEAHSHSGKQIALPQSSFSWQRNWHSGHHTRSNGIYALLFFTLQGGGWRREKAGRKWCTIFSISFPHLFLMSACPSVRVSVTAVALPRQLITDTTLAQPQPSRHAPNTLITSVVAAPPHFLWFACSCSFR